MEFIPNYIGIFTYDILTLLESFQAITNWHHKFPVITITRHRTEPIKLDHNVTRNLGEKIKHFST